MKRKNGFADTKQVPSKQHPAYFRWKKSNKVEYVTFTKHDPAIIKGKKIPVKKLSANIDPNKRGISDSNVVYMVFVGKRSALHKNIANYSFASEKDKEIVDGVFKNAPRVEINYTSNSRSKKKSK